MSKRQRAGTRLDERPTGPPGERHKIAPTFLVHHRTMPLLFGRNRASTARRGAALAAPVKARTCARKISQTLLVWATGHGNPRRARSGHGYSSACRRIAASGCSKLRPGLRSDRRPDHRPPSGTCRTTPGDDGGRTRRVSLFRIGPVCRETRITKRHHWRGQPRWFGPAPDHGHRRLRGVVRQGTPRQPCLPQAMKDCGGGSDPGRLALRPRVFDDWDVRGI